MSDQGENAQPVGEIHNQGNNLPEKRNRIMTQEALEYTVEIKRRNADKLEQKLWRVIRSVEALELRHCTSNVLRELITTTEEFQLILQELAGLYEQDKYGVFTSVPSMVLENTSLQCA